MLPFLLGAAGLALVLVPLVVRRRLSWPKPSPVLPALRAAHTPLPWERAYWRRASKGGRRG